MLVSLILIGLFIHSRRKTEPKLAPVVTAKTPSVDEKPELYYLSKTEMITLFGENLVKANAKQVRSLKTTDGKMEEFLPYLAEEKGSTTNVYFRTDKGIERYTFTSSSLQVDLAEKETKGKDFVLQTSSTPTFQYKDGETWFDYENSGSVQTKVEKGPNFATITQKTKSGGNDETVTWKIGIDDERLLLKNTFALSEKKNTNRMLWTIAFPKDKKVITTDDENLLRAKDNNTKKRLLLGNVRIAWEDFQEATKAALSAQNQTLMVLFYEDGISGPLTIDPTITTTVNVAAAQIDVEVDDGTRLWCFGMNPQETAGTRALFQPTRMHHDTLSAPTNCTTGGDDFLPNNAGAAKDAPLFSGTNGWDSTSGITVRLLESTATRARVQTYKDSTIDSKGLFTIYPNGYGFMSYLLGTVNTAEQSYTFSEHFKTASPQTKNYDATNRTYLIADTSNNNYPGALLMGFQVLGIAAVPNAAEDNAADYTQYWNSSVGGSTAAGTKASSAWNFLADLSEYRATTFTKDTKLADYRQPDDTSDNLVNAVQWDDAGEQDKYFTGFEGADADLCGGGDGFTTGSCNGDDTAVGNATGTGAYSGTYGAHFDGGATTTDVAYAELSMDNNPRQAVRFMFKVGAETLGTSQEMTIARFLGGSSSNNGSLAFRQNASNQLVLCVTPQRGGTNGTQVCGTTVLSTGTWYAVEFANVTGISAGTSYGDLTQVFLNGVIEASSSQHVLADVTTVAMRLGLIATSTANNDIYMDNVAIGYTEQGILGFNPNEGAYTLQKSTWANDLSVDIDRQSKIASGSAIKVRNWKSQNDPVNVKLEGKQLINGTDFNADVLPFSEAWVNDSDATCGTGGWQKLAEGGDSTDADEYLFDTGDNYNFQNGGSGNNCTFGDSSTDALYFGRTDRFSGLNIQLATLGLDNSAFATWEYCSANTDVATACDTWSTLSVTESVTGVSIFTNNGNLSFTPPSQMIRSTENTGREALYFVRARITGGSYITYPVEQKITSDIMVMQYQGTITQNDQTFTLSNATSPGGWKLDEGSGSTANDDTGLGNNLTISGAVWKGDGQRNNSSTKRATYLHFDGSNDYASRTSDTDFNSGSDPFTITGWFRHPLAVSGTDTILARYGSAGYKIYMDSSGHICFGTDADSSFGPADSACTTTTYTDSKWHHFAAIRNGTVPDLITYTSNIMIYIDGAFQGDDHQIISAGSLDTASTLYLGIDSDGSSNPWDGEIDEVRFYSYALTAAQIKADIPDPSSVLIGSNPTDPLLDNLVGWWKMDETAADTCTGGANDSCDSSGNAYDGAWTGNTTATSDSKYGYATTYDGTGDSTTISDVLDFERTQPFTLSTWVKTTTDAGQSLITKQDSNSPFSGYNLQFGSSGLLFFQLVNTYTTNAIEVQSTNNLSYNDGVWHHVAAVYDGTSKASGVKLYFDGVQIAMTTNMDNLDATTVNSIALNLGSRNNAAQFLNGQLDDARIYSKAMGGADIRMLYNYAPGPVGYWKFDEATGTSVADSSGNGNTATISDDVSIVGGWDSGKYGDTYNMRGNEDNDIINIGTDLSLGTRNTISYWANFFDIGGSGGANDAVVGGNTSSSTDGYMSYMDGTDLYSRQALASGVSVSATFTNGTWYHIEVVRDGTSVTFYRNGVQLGTTQTYGSNNPFTMKSLTNFEAGTAGFGLEGKIDDYRVYNYPRTAQQVAEDMNGGHPSGGSPLGTQLLFWNLDEQGGNTINNRGYGGTTYNGTNSGAAWLTASTCKANGCLNFNTTTDNVSAGDLASIDGMTSFTTSFWLDPQTLSTNKMIVSKANTSTERVFQIKSDDSTNTELKVMISSSSSDTSNYCVTSGLGLTATTWQYIAVVYDGNQAAANRVKVFKNGKSITCTVTGTIPTSLVSSTTSNFKIGEGDDTTPTALISYMDEFKFYSGALNQDQILIDYNMGAAANVGTGQNEEAQASGGAVAPVAWYKMDEGTGTSTTFDSSGNNNDLTMNSFSSAAWITGKYGNALNFNGASSYLSVADNSTLQAGNGSVTLMAWAKPPNSNISAPIIAKRQVASPFEQYSLWICGADACGSSGQLLSAYFAENLTTITRDSTSTADVADGNWHHYAMVADKTNDVIYLYMDGIRLATTTRNVGVWPTVNDTTALQLGMTASIFFPAAVDEAKIFMSALSPAQIAYEYNRGRAMHAYRIDECTSTTLNDVGGSTTLSNGTLTVGASGTNTTTGSCTVVNTAAAWYNGANGKFNSSLRFDGTDDYADLGDQPDTETRAQMSWSFWVKPNTLATAKCIFCKANSAATQQGWAFRTDASTSTTLRVAIPTGTTDQSTYGSVTTALANGSWTHVVAVYDGTATGNSNRLKIYINGILTTPTYTGTIPAATTATTSNARIGAASDTADFFNGQVDEVQLFPYPLTLIQVQKLFNQDAGTRFGPTTGSP